MQGPKARELLAPLVEEIDLSRRGHAAYERARGRDLRRAARLMRVSFTGELGFEINVPADFGRAVWEAVWRAAARTAAAPTAPRRCM